jgi:hypothetical protein
MLTFLIAAALTASPGCETLLYRGEPVCVARFKRERETFYSRIHTVRPVQKFVPRTEVYRPATMKGEKLNKRAVRKALGR